MINRTSSERPAAAWRFSGGSVARSRHGVILVVGMLGLAPVSCLSDLTLPPCPSEDSCGGMAGAGKPEAEAAGEGGAGGDAGAPGSCSGGLISGVAGGGVAGGGGSSRCSSCTLSPPTLPAPCAASAYSTQLRIVGGTAPYTWRLAPALEGWQIETDSSTVNDGSRAVLSTGHPGAPEVSVEVEDATGKLTTGTYAVTPRTACSFAYTALDADGPKLHLVDPILRPDQPLALAHNQGVYDFAYSPNGKYLAYRFGADPDHARGRQLSLIDLATWTERVLSFADGSDSGAVVTSYAWSPDSATLAAAFTQGGTQYLGAVRLTVGQQPSGLTPIQTPVDSELYWIGASYVAFYAKGVWDASLSQLVADDSGAVTAFHSKLGAAGFDPVVLSTETQYFSDVFLQPATSGFFMIAEDLLIQFNPVPAQGPFAPVFVNNFLSPSGRFTAHLLGNQLQLFFADSDQVVAATSEPQQTCTRFLSWAKARERMACVADAPADAAGVSHSEIRIFDLDSENKLTMSPIQDYCHKGQDSTTSCEALEYDYDQASADHQPRTFSASGQWFAFTTGSVSPDDNYLYLADLRSRPFTLKAKLTGTGNGSSTVVPTNISFSPGDKYLMRQLGTSLSIQSVETGSSTLLLKFHSNEAESNETCGEDFLIDPTNWCGSANRRAPFGWSPDSKFAAYRSQGSTSAAEEGLTVVDFAQFPAIASHWLKAKRCDGQCSDQFVFQPEN